MSTAGIARSQRSATPCVVSLLDGGGEVAASIADVSAPALELTPAVVQLHAADIGRCQLLVLDANLGQATLAAAVAAAAAAGVRVLFEPVSVPKAAR
jgi:pseudouridine kinase